MTSSSPIRSSLDLSDWFCRDIPLSLAGSAASLTFGYAALEKSHLLLQKLDLLQQQPFSYFGLYDLLSGISHPLLGGMLKTLAVVYTIALVPLFEEWLFRDILYSWQEKQDAHIEGMGIRVYRVITNGLLFGAFHLSLFLAWANIPILVVSTIAGLVFAALREFSGSWRASTIAHMINNSFVLLTKL